MSDKNYKTEWSFSFERIGDSIRQVVDGIRDSVDGEPEEVKFASFSEPVNGRENASVFVAFGTGHSTVSPLVASENLIEADINYIGEVEFVVNDDPSKPTVVLRQLDSNLSRSIKSARNAMGDKPDLRWDVRLTPEIPLHLHITGGVGKSELNLAGLNLTQFNYESGVGTGEMTLPALDTRYTVDIDSGVGSTTVNLLENTDVDLDINGGVGRTQVMVPEGAAVRVEATVGIGKVSLPSHFVKQEGQRHFIGERGIWQTENYDDAEHRVDITFEGGVGKFEVVVGSQVV